MTIAGARRDLAAPFLGSPVVRGGIGEEDRGRLNAKGREAREGKTKGSGGLLLGGRIDRGQIDCGAEQLYLSEVELCRWAENKNQSLRPITFDAMIASLFMTPCCWRRE